MDDYSKQYLPGGCTSGSKYTSANSKVKIRDNMDGVLETNGFYRKHVANEPDSIYRAVSDVLFDTQYYRHLVKKARNLLVNSVEGRIMLRRNKSFPLNERTESRLIQCTMSLK